MTIVEGFLALALLLGTSFMWGYLRSLQKDVVELQVRVRFLEIVREEAQKKAEDDQEDS